MHRRSSVMAFLLSSLIASFIVVPSGVSAQASDGAFSAADTIWIVVAAALVFLMQAGFALLGAGALRGKNVVNYLTKSVMDFGFGALAFFAVGFGLMFGGSAIVAGVGDGGWLAGTSGFLLGGDAAPDALVFFLFQVMFAATAATIVAGAVAERMRLHAYVIYTIAITALIYPIAGHWVWGGGFLAALPFGAGAVDFAGSGVVHAVGGLLALVAAWLVGPRLGRYDDRGRAQDIPGHNMTYVVLGTMLLFFGWFGFNAGSTLSATDTGIALIAVNTFLAGCAGAVAVFTILGVRRAPLGIGNVCNGILAGLVAITAGCAFVDPWAAVVIGAAGGAIYLWAANFLTHRMRIDDPVGAIAVHGVTGLFGLVAVGVFANGTGGVAGLIVGETGQLVAQVLAAGALAAWTLVVGYALFKVLDVTVGLRVTERVERDGLDSEVHGTTAYPELAAILTSAVAPGGKKNE